MESDKPIRLKVIPIPPKPRTVYNQSDAKVPVFRGQDWMGPDWQCGKCGNTLATQVRMGPASEEGVVRWLPAPEGGEMSVLSVSIPAGEVIQSERGPMVVRCAACGSFNELVPADD